jgi:hypothetical protein
MIENATNQPTELEPRKPKRTAVAETNETLVINYKRSPYDPAPLSVKLLSKPLLEGGNLVSEQEWDVFIQSKIGQLGMSKGSFRRVGTQQDFLSQPIFEQVDLVEKSHSGEFLAWAVENGEALVQTKGRDRFKAAGLDYDKAKVA